MNLNLATLSASHFELRFESLFQQGRALAFPCDASGRVELARRSQRRGELSWFII